MESPRPTVQNARDAAEKFCGAAPLSVGRYPTGMCHSVYEVAQRDGSRIVVRMGYNHTRDVLKGSVFWDRELQRLELPTARILYADLDAPFPYNILDYLPGRDLGTVYSALLPSVKVEVASAVAAIQDRVGELPQGQGFGYGYSYNDPRLIASWLRVLDGQLDRARQLIREAGIVSEACVDRVGRAVRRLSEYLHDVEPAPFLDDTTTKNVLVSESGLVGIVDIDEVCFGDRLYVVSLTKMSLLSSNFSLDYIEYWSDAWKLSSLQRQVLDTYTAIHCVGFLGEVGQKCNKEVAEIEPGRVERLETILDSLLG